jgi:hypothetical protein
VTDRSRIALFVLAGAVLGGLAGFLMFTDRGRRLRAELEPHLDEFTRELQQLQEMATHVRRTATESWRRVEHVIDELGAQGKSWAGQERPH